MISDIEIQGYKEMKDYYENRLKEVRKEIENNYIELFRRIQNKEEYFTSVDDVKNYCENYLESLYRSERYRMKFYRKYDKLLKRIYDV